MYEEVECKIEDMIFVPNIPLDVTIAMIKVENNILLIINPSGVKILQVHLQVTPDRKFVRVR